MQSFKDYNASQIAPQMTLIKKLQKIIQWLETHEDKNATRLYKHTITFYEPNLEKTCVMELISSREEKFTSQYFHEHYDNLDIGKGPVDYISGKIFLPVGINTWNTCKIIQFNQDFALTAHFDDDPPYNIDGKYFELSNISLDLVELY